MKRTVMLLALLASTPTFAELPSDLGDAPTVADITAQFAAREALRVQAENLQQMVVLGFKYSIDRAREEIAEVLAQVLISRDLAAQRQAEIDALKAQAATDAARTAAVKAAAVSALAAASKATTIAGLRAALVPLLAVEAK